VDIDNELQLGAATTFLEVASGHSATYSGVIGGAGFGFEKVGAGALILSGSTSMTA
jgi:hypothetical protein